MRNKNAWIAPFLFLASTLALLLLVAACGGTGEEEAATPTATSAASPVVAAPTATPAASPATATATAASGGVACQALQDLNSFRFTLRVQLEIPELQEQIRGADSGGTPGPLDQFTQGLMALLSDLNIAGAYVRPDRSQVTMKLAGEDISVITIGDREWTRIGALPWTESVVSPGSSPAFSPDDLCDLTGDLLVEGLEGEPETLDGVKTRHYRIDNAALSTLANLFDGAADLGDLPETFTMDIWLAEEGQWPVRLSIEAADKDDQGRDVRVAMAMELKDINSPDIRIEPPQP